MFSEPSFLREVGDEPAQDLHRDRAPARPTCPLCTGWSRHLTSTSTWQMPRSW